MNHEPPPPYPLRNSKPRIPAPRWSRSRKFLSRCEMRGLRVTHQSGGVSGFRADGVSRVGMDSVLGLSEGAFSRATGG